MAKKRNLSLSYCMAIFEKYDPEMYAYLQGRNESALNMDEVSAAARDCRPAGANTKAYDEANGLVAKSYKISKVTADAFTAACKERGEPIGKALERIMAADIAAGGKP